MSRSLSILIPSVPSRFFDGQVLYEDLMEQVGTMDVEILMLTDNKKRSVGKKRQALVELATKDYVTFIDDDDAPMNNYVSEIYQAIQEGFDAVLFNSSCKMNDDPAVHVDHGMAFPDEEYNPKGFRRNLWHVHAIRSDIAKSHPWPDTSYGEDIGWLRQVRKDIIWTYKIDKVLYCYQFDSGRSETQ